MSGIVVYGGKFIKNRGGEDDRIFVLLRYFFIDICRGLMVECFYFVKFCLLII